MEKVTANMSMSLDGYEVIPEAPAPVLEEFCAG